MSAQFRSGDLALRRAAALCALLILCACGKEEDSKPPERDSAAAGVVLSAEQMKSLGLVTVSAQAASYRGGVSGYGTVVPLDTIAQADADYLTARAAALQSQAAARRANYLFGAQGGAVSRESMEAAQSKAAADQASLALARRKAEATFGHDAPWENNALRPGLMARLAAGGLVLVRVTFPLGTAEEMPQSLSIARLGGGAKRWISTRLWQAPADPGFPGRGIFALVEGSDLAQNDHVNATIPSGPEQPGVEVPPEAVVYGEGSAWVYVRRGDRFVRVQISPDLTLPGGYFLAQRAGIRPGDRIVTGGAGLLLARELNPSTEAGD